MSYVYSDVEKLEGTNKVGSKQCVVLIQQYAKAPTTNFWKEGTVVVGDVKLAKGTAIATFVGGSYQSHSTGNHAGLFISHDVSGGIWVMDQWLSDTSKPKVSKRLLRRKGKLSDGKYVDPSNNADAYSVIE